MFVMSMLWGDRMCVMIDVVWWCSVVGSGNDFIFGGGGWWLVVLLVVLCVDYFELSVIIL